MGMVEIVEFRGWGVDDDAPAVWCGCDVVIYLRKSVR
jgi:hypothetical protein